MPYIKPKDRPVIQLRALELAHQVHTVGDFNYAVSAMLHVMVQREGHRYSNMNALVGAMECCKLEFVRTVLSPYEDRKRLENGGVSELDAITMEDVQ